MSTKILTLAFDQAKKEIGSTKKTHLAQHLSDLLLENYNYVISERTLRDYYSNYESGTEGAQEDLKPKLISCLCNYLGYTDYADFVQKNSALEENHEKKEGKVKKNGNESKPLNLTKVLVFSTGFILIVIVIMFWTLPTDLTMSESKKCMAWSDSLYVEVSCSSHPYSEFGTKVEPMDRVKLNSFKKVEVTMSTPFFSEDERPLIWYYKNSDNEIEYFTAPGLHPTTGETLRKITPYIIQTYVPLHTNNGDTFLKEN